jgi:predicted component of type VI protein secretion system
MFRCLLIQISHNKRGQPVHKDLLFTRETVQIGRAAVCDILLLDHRVNLHHALIQRVDGRPHIECEEGSVLYINGSAQSSAELTPGTHVIIGPYELIVKTPTGDYDLVLSVEMVRSLPDDQEHIAAKQLPVP